MLILRFFRYAAFAVLWAFTGIPASAAEYGLAPGSSVIGNIGRYVTKQGDLLHDVARQFDLGYTRLMAANPTVDPWVPGTGRSVMIPTIFILPDAPHDGIVINLAQWRLFYFAESGRRVVTFPLGLGVIGRTTPRGTTRIVGKVAHPAWRPTPSIRAAEPDLPAIVPAGPDNPLGDYALRLGWRHYLIHGTNKPDGVGRNVSHGCIRLYPEDIERLFHEVRVGALVHVVTQPATAGWSQGRLYLVVYPSKAQAEEIDTERPITPEPAKGVRHIVTAAAGPYAEFVDWEVVDRAAQQRNALPVVVAENPVLDFSSAAVEAR